MCTKVLSPPSRSARGQGGVIFFSFPFQSGDQLPDFSDSCARLLFAARPFPLISAAATRRRLDDGLLVRLLDRIARVNMHPCHGAEGERPAVA